MAKISCIRMLVGEFYIVLDLEKGEDSEYGSPGKLRKLIQSEILSIIPRHQREEYEVEIRHISTQKSLTNEITGCTYKAKLWKVRRGQ